MKSSTSWKNRRERLASTDCRGTARRGAASIPPRAEIIAGRSCETRYPGAVNRANKEAKYIERRPDERITER